MVPSLAISGPVLKSYWDATPEDGKRRYLRSIAARAPAAQRRARFRRHVSGQRREQLYHRRRAGRQRRLLHAMIGSSGPAHVS